MKVNLTKRELQKILTAIASQSVADPVLANIYEKLKLQLAKDTK